MSDRRLSRQQVTGHPFPRAVLLSTAVLITVLDLATKEVATRWLPPSADTPRVLLGLVRPVRNDEFSLQLFGTGHYTSVVIMALTAVIGVWVGTTLVRRGRVHPVVTGMALGGAAANTIDRAIHGAVADFIVTGPIVINIADLAVLFAVLLVAARVGLGGPAHLGVAPDEANMHAGGQGLEGVASPASPSPRRPGATRARASDAIGAATNGTAAGLRCGPVV